MPLRRGLAATALACVALLMGPESLAAQSTGNTHSIGVSATVHAGGTAFTRFQNVTLEAPAAPQGTYPASLAASTAASLGADIALWLVPWLGVRLHAGYAPSTFELRLTEEDREEVLGDEADYQRLEYSDVSVFTTTLAAVLTLPTRSTRVLPYVLLGGGGILYSADDRGAQGLEEALNGDAIAVRLAGLAGVGVKIPLASARVSLSFEIVDHVTRSPLRANDDRVLLDTGELRVRNRAHPMAADTNVHYAHAIGVAAGLTFSLGRDAPQ